MRCASNVQCAGDGYCFGAARSCAELETVTATVQPSQQRIRVKIAINSILHGISFLFHTSLSQFISESCVRGFVEGLAGLLGGCVLYVGAGRGATPPALAASRLVYVQKRHVIVLQLIATNIVRPHKDRYGIYSNNTRGKGDI